MNEEQFEYISEKLEQITRLIALSIWAEEETTNNKILRLSAIGFQPAEISKILNISGGYVRSALSKARKKTKGKR
jgi:DNA-directed RNA polymerase specialized sigma24 family protein